MTTVRRLLRSLLLSLSCLLLIVSMGRTESTALRVAVEPVYPPFEFRAPNGEMQGFDIDVMRAIGKAAGFTVQFQSIAFDGMIPALQAQTVDAAISAMTITPARSNVVTFSRPYFKAGLAIAVREGTENVNRLEDLSGKSIAVQIGTTGADAAKKIPGATIRTFNAAVLTLQELHNGNVDAIINDAPVMLYAIKTGNLKGIRVVNQLLTEDFYGIPTPRNSPNLQRINQGLGAILSNGTYAQLYQKWFDAQPPALPATAPASATGNTTAMPSSAQVILASLPPLLAGTLITLQLATIAVMLGLVGGSLMGILRLSKVRLLRWAAAIYIDFFRGTPLLVQLFMLYFGLPAAFQAFGLTFSFDRFLAAIAALSLNCAAYVAEIVRAGIQSIETGQSEAAKSLGLDAIQTLRFVVFPQALRRMLPPLGNQFISLLKDTSLVAVIGFEELFRRGQLIVAENYRPFELYFAIALIYLALTLLSSQSFSYLERRMDPAQRGRSRFAK